MKSNKVRGKDVKNILTRFFFKKDEPCFQIILQMEGSRETLGEYNSYPEYKRKMEVVKVQVEENELIDLPNNTRSVPMQPLKVAANI